MKVCFFLRLAVLLVYLCLPAEAAHLSNNEETSEDFKSKGLLSRISRDGANQTLSNAFSFTTALGVELQTPRTIWFDHCVCFCEEFKGYFFHFDFTLDWCFTTCKDIIKCGIKKDCKATTTACGPCFDCCVIQADSLAEANSCANDCVGKYGPDKCYGCNSDAYCSCGQCLKCCTDSCNDGDSSCFDPCNQRCVQRYNFACPSPVLICPEATTGCAQCFDCCGTQTDTDANFFACAATCEKKFTLDKCYGCDSGKYCDCAACFQCCTDSCKGDSTCLDPCNQRCSTKFGFSCPGVNCVSSSPPLCTTCLDCCAVQSKTFTGATTCNALCVGTYSRDDCYDCAKDSCDCADCIECCNESCDKDKDGVVDPDEKLCFQTCDQKCVDVYLSGCPKKVCHTLETCKKCTECCGKSCGKSQPCLSECNEDCVKTFTSSCPESTCATGFTRCSDCEGCCATQCGPGTTECKTKCIKSCESTYDTSTCPSTCISMGDCIQCEACCTIRCIDSLDKKCRDSCVQSCGKNPPNYPPKTCPSHCAATASSNTCAGCGTCCDTFSCGASKSCTSDCRLDCVSKFASLGCDYSICKNLVTMDYCNKCCPAACNNEPTCLDNCKGVCPFCKA